MVPAEGGPKILKRKSSWHRRRRPKQNCGSQSQTLEGEEGGGVWGGVPPLLPRCTAVLIHHCPPPPHHPPAVPSCQRALWGAHEPRFGHVIPPQLLSSAHNRPSTARPGPPIFLALATTFATPPSASCPPPPPGVPSPGPIHRQRAAVIADVPRCQWQRCVLQRCAPGTEFQWHL